MKPLEIRETKSGELSIPGLAFVEVVSMKEVINYLAEGIKVSFDLELRTGPRRRPKPT